MRKLSAWARSHPATAIVIALAAFILSAHFFLNWQSERRWQAYVNAARVRGVKIYLSDFASPKIPEAENFAALPMFKAIIKGGVQRPMELPEVLGSYPPFGNRLKDEPLDWQKWQMFFQNAGYIAETTDSPPRDVLRALDHYSSQFAEWSEWKDRPHCRFPLDNDAGMDLGVTPYNMGTHDVELSPLSTFQDASKLFNLRMRALLALRGRLKSKSFQKL